MDGTHNKLGSGRHLLEDIWVGIYQEEILVICCNGGHMGGNLLRRVFGHLLEVTLVDVYWEGMVSI